jgi:hypothetical protein
MTKMTTEQKRRQPPLLLLAFEDRFENARAIEDTRDQR